MKNNNYANNIYYRPLKTWHELTPEQKQNWERDINTFRKSAQRAGTCCVPLKQSYQCDMLCEKCEYHRNPASAPQYIHIDYDEYKTEFNLVNSDFSDGVIETKIIIRDIFDFLKESEPENYKILNYIYQGYTHREVAKEMNMSLSTFNDKYKKLKHSLQIFIGDI